MTNKGSVEEIVVALLLLSKARQRYRVPEFEFSLSKVLPSSFTTTFGSHPLLIDNPKSVCYQEFGIHFDWKEHVAISAAQA